MVGPFDRDSERRASGGGGGAQRALDPWERAELLRWLEERRVAALPEFDRALARLEKSGAASPLAAQPATPRNFVPVRFGPRQPGVGGAGPEGADARAPALNTGNRAPMYIFPDGQAPAPSGADPFAALGRSRSAQPAARPRGRQPWERMAEMMRARPAPTEPDPMVAEAARLHPSRVPPGVSIDPNGVMSTQKIDGSLASSWRNGGSPYGQRRVGVDPAQQQYVIESLLDADSHAQGGVSPEEAAARRSAPTLAQLRRANANRESLRDPRVRAFLDTIATTEGWRYDGIFGNNSFSDYSTHPKQNIRWRGGVSSAAGRYQINQDTWEDFSRRLGMTDFAPETQDLMAVEILRDRRALEALQANDLPRALEIASTRWASLPNGRGEGRAKGQPYVPYDRVERIYGDAMRRRAQQRR
jgi:muramidase (phage lysozyme)